MSEYAPTVAVAFCVDRYDDTLVPELASGLENEIRIVYRCSVEADLVGPGVQHLSDVVQVAKPATNCEGHEAFGCGLLDDVMHDLPFVTRCGDIEENEFVGTLLVVRFRTGNRIARIAQFFELYPFDHAARVNVKAGNDSFCEHSFELKITD